MNVLARALSRTVVARSLPTTSTVRMAPASTTAVKDWGLPSASTLFETDEQLRSIPEDVRQRFMAPKSGDAIARTRKALEANGHTVHVAKDRNEALEILNKIVPKGVDVTSVGSTTLVRLRAHNCQVAFSRASSLQREIGYIDASAAGLTPGVDVRPLIAQNKDESKARELRGRRATAAFSIGSVSAISETGDIVLADASGTRIAPMLSTDKAIFIIGSNKIEPTLDDAMKRLHDWAYLVESARARREYGLPAAFLNNVSIFRRQFPQDRFHVILVEESLGY